MRKIAGYYYAAGQSTAIRATASESETGSIRLYAEEDQQQLVFSAPSQHQFGMVLANLPVDLTFSSGAVFTPDDSAFRWMHQNDKQNVLSKIETHLGVVLAACVIIPVFMCWFVIIAIPNTAEKGVDLLPQSVFEQVEKESLAILEKTFLEPSTLAVKQQETIRDMWNEALIQLSLEPAQYQLLLRASGFFDANAFALPNGTVVVTDDLVALLDGDDDALLAIILHEIAHVEFKHGMKLAARSIATTIFFALMLGDIDGVGEYVIGASSSLLENSFSRDMETEADAYAIDKLQQLGKSPNAFADAMAHFLLFHESEGITEISGDVDNVEIEGKESEGVYNLSEYFSTHPDTQARIQAARDAAKALENKIQ